MPFISTDKVKEIRKALKVKFPRYTFSVRKDNHSCVDVALMAGPKDFGMEDSPINHFWYKEHFADQPELVKLIGGILETINSVKEQRTITHDGDYGSVPNFYISLSFGRFNKPYKVKDKKTKKKPTKPSYTACLEQFFNFA